MVSERDSLNNTSNNATPHAIVPSVNQITCRDEAQECSTSKCTHCRGLMLKLLSHAQLLRYQNYSHHQTPQATRTAYTHYLHT